ncbi:hypothetical protein [Bacillus sp. JCM 19041]|uniref:hypothetical protein n=1 Tax=Bacillus sp. JCM 19041 TaxID=1460637 RepID=UPI0006D176B7
MGQRYQERKSKRANRILNVAITIVAVLIIFLGGSLALSYFNDSSNDTVVDEEQTGLVSQVMEKRLKKVMKRKIQVNHLMGMAVNQMKMLPMKMKKEQKTKTKEQKMKIVQMKKKMGALMKKLLYQQSKQTRTQMIFLALDKTGVKCQKLFI